MGDKMTFTQIGMSYLKETKSNVLLDQLTKQVSKKDLNFSNTNNNILNNNSLNTSNNINNNTNQNNIRYSYASPFLTPAYKSQQNSPRIKSRSSIQAFPSINQTINNNQKLETSQENMKSHPFYKLKNFGNNNSNTSLLSKNSNVDKLNNKLKSISFSQTINKKGYPESYQAQLLAEELIKSYYKPIPLKQNSVDHYKTKKVPPAYRQAIIERINKYRYNKLKMEQSMRRDSQEQMTSPQNTLRKKENSFSPSKMLQSKYEFQLLNKPDSLLDQNHILIPKQDRSQPYNDRLAKQNIQKQNKFKELFSKKLEQHKNKKEDMHQKTLESNEEFWKVFKDHSQYAQNLSEVVQKQKNRQFYRISSELHGVQQKYHSKIPQNYMRINEQKIQINDYKKQRLPKDVPKRIQEKYNFKEIPQKSNQIKILVNFINKQKKMVKQFREKKKSENTETLQQQQKQKQDQQIQKKQNRKGEEVTYFNKTIHSILYEQQTQEQQSQLQKSQDSQKSDFQENRLEKSE